jgi:hypothetical protein
MSRIIHKLLAKSPDERYQTPGDLMADLLALAARYDLRIPTPPAIPAATLEATRRRGRIARHLPWLVPTILLAIGVAAMALRPKEPEPVPQPVHHAAAPKGLGSPSPGQHPG